MKRSTVFRILCGLGLATAVAPLQGMSQKVELVVKTGHSGSVMTVVASPDGKLIATGGGDNNIILWEGKTASQLRMLTGRAPIRSLAFNADGSTIASGDDGGLIQMWDVDSGRAIRDVGKVAGPVASLAFSPDGQRLAAGGLPDKVKVWDLSHEGSSVTLEWPRPAAGSGLSQETLAAFAVSLAFSPDGTRLAAGTSMGAQVWTVGNEWKPLYLNGHRFLANSIAFSADSTHLLSGGDDKAGKLWDLTTGAEIRTYSGSLNNVLAVSFAQNGSGVCAGSAANSVICWDTATGAELSRIRGNPSRISAATFDRSGRNFLVSGDDGELNGPEDMTVRVWDVESGKLVSKLSGEAPPVRSADLSADGGVLAIGNEDGSILVWSTASNEPPAVLHERAGATTPILLSPDGKRLVFAGDAKGFTVWDTRSRRPLRTLSRKGPDLLLAGSADGSTIAAVNENYDTYIWRNTGLAAPTIDGKAFYFSPSSIALSRDGRYLALGSGDESNAIWIHDRLLPKRPINISPTEYSDQYDALAFSPDGRLLAGSAEWGIGLWDITSRKPSEVVLSKASTGATVLEFSPDGSLLAAAGSDNVITLWDVRTRTAVSTLPGHQATIGSLRFARGHSLLVSSSSDGKVKLWNVVKRREICSISTVQPDSWVVTTPDGRFDTNDLDSPRALAWVLSDEPRTARSLSLFMREYYEPGLLRRALACDLADTCAKEFQRVPYLAGLLRTQPLIIEVRP